MLSILQKIGRSALALLQRPLDRVFTTANNPLNHLGSLTIYFCWIILISGIWLLIFFQTSVSGAFESLEYLTHQQWYLGGIMRSLHRYASDGAIITLLIHIIKEFSMDTYRVKRWFSWITGMPLVWIVFTLGITGYWLVWDELAQYVAITSAELLDRIPIFTNSMAANFLSDAVLSDRFFTVMAFLHLIGLPIFLVFGIWLHIFRLSRPSINPPRELMAGTLLSMLVLSLVFPAYSQPKADLTMATTSVQLDWFYLHAYPLVQAWSPGLVWALLVGISTLIVAAPWLPPGKKTQAAKVDLANCNGCQRCVEDCPFSAVQMMPRSDGRSYEEEAVVDPDLCVSCGICVGSCPTSTPFRSKSALIPGIDLPELPVADLKELIVAAAGSAGDGARVMCFACKDSQVAKKLKGDGEIVIEVKCMGQVPPSFLDFALSRGHADGVFLTACTVGGCRYRFGTDWTADRVARVRDPRLRKRVDVAKVAKSWEDFDGKSGDVRNQLQSFRESLQASAIEDES